MHVAVVIPVAATSARTARCLRACAALTYEPRTIAVVSDAPLPLPDDPHFVNVVTHAAYLTSPAEKRDLASAALPDVAAYAYLDDDAYPEPAWLDRVVAALAAHPSAAGVGGPGLMPDDQRFWERVSARVLESHLGSGPLRFRFWRDPARWCDDFPAYDLTLCRQALEAAGGWATDWYGGEDTWLCARLADAGRLIWYDPDAFVFHYRRALLPHHFWQIQNVGRSRGCFVRSGRARFRSIALLGPPAFVAGVALVVWSPLAIGPTAYPLIALAYGAVALFGHPRPLAWNERLALPLGLIVHHVAYTTGLMRGLLTGKRRRAMRPPQPRREDPSSNQ